MDKLFLDANVVIDFLCQRNGFYLPAAKIIAKGYKREVELWCSSLTFAIASYIMERGHVPSDEIFQKLTDFLTVCQPSIVDRSIIEKALTSNFEDFEDALQYFSAKNCGVNIIITRNMNDFFASDISILSPTDYIVKKE